MAATAAPSQRFWLLWSASTATNLGDGMRLVALPLLATSVTTDVRQIALVTVATFAPLLVFGPFAGVLIDRTDRRNAIVVAHLARAVLLLGLAALIAADRVTLGWVIVAAVLYGVLASSPLLRGLAVMIGLWALAAGTFWGIGVVYALDELDSGEAGFGVMVSLSAVGSLLGAAITRRVIGRFGIFPTAMAAITVSTVVVAAMSLANHLLVAAGLLALNSVALSCWIIFTITIRQTVVPAHLLGRVSAADRMLYALSFPSGAALAGLLASAIGTRLTFLISAVPILLAALMLPSLRRPLIEAWAQAHQPSEPGDHS
jgi:multisubunit Na+/H+ antiporter MnhE subunit